MGIIQIMGLKGRKKIMDDLRSIDDYNKLNLAKTFGKYLKAPWYFEKAYEKIILIGLGILGVWKIFGWVI